MAGPQPTSRNPRPLPSSPAGLNSLGSAVSGTIAGIANQIGGSGTVTVDSAGGTGSLPGINDPISNLPLSSALYQNAQGAAPGKFENNWPRNGQLVHGYMKTTPNSSGIPKEFFLFFLFNPLEIDNAYNFDTQVLPAAFQDQSSKNEAAIMQNQAITFTLPFDRTYEVSDFMASNIAKSGQTSPNPSQNPALGPGSLGVMWDIRALERLVGMYDDTSPLPTQPQVGTGNVQPTGTPNPAQASPVDVFFGNQLYFRGYFSQLEIDVQRFSHTMVPVHCEITITLSRIWLDPAQLDLNHGPTIMAGAQALQTPGGSGAPVFLPGNTNLVPGITTIDPATTNPTVAPGGADTFGGGPTPGPVQP